MFHPNLLFSISFDIVISLNEDLNLSLYVCQQSPSVSEFVYGSLGAADSCL